MSGASGPEHPGAAHRPAPAPSDPSGDASVFSFHLARVAPHVTAAALVRPPAPRTVPGLRHVECLAAMTLGSPVVSTQRLRLGRLAVFARWDDEDALDRFLADDALGRRLATGWHVRLELLRRWGSVRALADLPELPRRSRPSEPVVAVTLAHLRLPELARFVHWGRPVEQLVRDHPGTRLALAAVRPPRTFSTFTVWRTTRDMTDMVTGRAGPAAPERHARAMRERERRDFHHEFTTLRFRPLSEHGTWDGRADLTAAAPDA